MNAIKVDESLVAYCGLYCAACGAYRKGRCPGCRDNVKATWCKIRACCVAAERSSCAECADFDDPSDCRKFNNLIAKVFGLLSNSDRRACIAQIKAKGRRGHAEAMAALGRQSIRRR